MSCQSYFTNSYPLANNQNIDFTGTSSTNPYSLLQNGGKKTKKRKHKNKRKNKRKRSYKKN